MRTSGRWRGHHFHKCQAARLAHANAGRITYAVNQDPLNDNTPDRIYDRNFLLAFVGQTCFVCANTLMAHYARWIEFLGGDLRQVGLITGVGATLGLVLRPWMAQWINRIGARAMWGIGYIVFGVASISNLWLHDASQMIYLVRTMLALGTAIVFASGLTYISQTSPDHRRTEAIGIFGIGGFLGMLIGPLLGDSFLADRTRDNFTMLFGIATVASLLPAMGLYFLRPPHSERTKSSVRLSEFLLVTRRHWPGMILWIDFVFGVCMVAPFIFMASFIDASSIRIDGISVIGLFFFCYAGIGIAIRLWSRRLPDRIGNKRVLLAGMAFMSIGMMCFGMVDAEHSWMIVVPALLTGTGHSLMFHTMMSLTLESFPLNVRGTGSALALVMLDLGAIVGAPILGMIGESFGFPMLFGTIGALCLLSALAYATSKAEVTASIPVEDLDLIEPEIAVEPSGAGVR